MIKVPISILAALLLLTGVLSAQSDELIFKPIVSENGRPATSVYSTIEDQFGFIWFAQNGNLIKFDGNDLKFFNSEPFDENSISSGRSLSLFEDHLGRILIPSSTDLCRYDPKSGNFEHFIPPIPDSSSDILSARVFDVLEDRNNTLWVSTEFGIYTLNDQTGVFSSVYQYVNLASEILTPQGPFLESIGGELFIGTPDGLFVKRSESIDLEPIPLAHEETRADIRGLSMGADGTLWISVWEEGLYRLENGEAIAERLVFDEFGDDAEINSKIYSLCAGPSGILWLGCEHEGLYGYNPLSGKMIYSPSEIGGTGSLKGNLTSVYEDSHNNLWVSMWEGQFRANLEPVKFRQDLPGVIAFMITQYTEDEFFVGSENSVIYWNRETGESLGLSEALGFPVPDVKAFAQDILVDKHQRLWIAFWKVGVLMIEPDSQSFTWFRDDSPPIYQIPSNFPIMLHEDISGVLWLSLVEQGLLVLDEESGSFVAPDLLSSDKIPDADHFLEDGNGTIWIGRQVGGGIMSVNRDTGKIVSFSHNANDPHSLVGNDIHAFERDSEGYLWCGDSSNGISIVNPETGRCENITVGSGLPDGGIMSLIALNPEDVWVGTMFGLVHITGKERQIRIYYAKDGLPSNEFNGRGATVATDGTLLFGTMNGIVWFDPKKIVDAVERNIPNRILNVRTLGDREQWENAYFLEKVIVPWRDNSLTISYQAMDMRPDAETNYAVKLDGLDKDWIEVGTDKQTNYFNLPGGRYSFYVKSTIEAGLWCSEENWGRLIVYVETHPAKTWWAVTSYILAGAILLLVAFFRYRSSQQKKLVRERQVSDRLRKVDNLKDQFLTNTTHELRTPLNGIIGLAESLLEKTGRDISEGMKKELSLIASSGRRLAYLINDILDLSRLKGGDITLNSGPVDLAKLTNTVLVLSKPLLAGKNVELINRIPDDLPMAGGDINRIQQILHNLIGNAVKFTPQGEITVSAYLKSEQIEVIISDTGIGIPDDKQDAIWESFQQIDGSESREYSGTGLGLPITRQLVNLHGGEIRLESEPGKGSSFIFTLPVSHEKRSGDTMDSVARVLSFDLEEKSPGHFFDGERKVAHILLVDDEAVNRHVVQSQLEGQRYALKPVASGKEALKSIEEELPDLVLLDIMMPGMDGYEVCEKIREKYSAGELPVIMVSAKNQVADLVRGLSAGANDFISKPYSGRELIARMDRHLDVKTAHSSFGKFVPRDLLKLIESSDDKKLNRPMTVLLTSFSVNRKSEESDVFSFVSSFLPDVLPIIRKNRGIIFRYEGEGILSFFPESPVDALQASLMIEELVGQYNKKQKNGDSLQMESSIHEESILLGITGDEKFTSELVSSRIIEQTLQLNKLGKLLGSAITTDETTLPRINGNGKQRLLAYVPDGKTGECKPVYEIIATKSKTAQHKLNSSSEYGEALKSFHDFKFDEASARFSSILEENPQDRAAEIYKERCLFYMNNPPTGKNVSIM